MPMSMFSCVVMQSFISQVSYRQRTAAATSLLQKVLLTPLYGLAETLFLRGDDKFARPLLTLQDLKESAKGDMYVYGKKSPCSMFSTKDDIYIDWQGHIDQ